MTKRTVSVHVSTEDLAALYFALDWVHQIFSRHEKAITAAGSGPEAKRWTSSCERVILLLLEAENRLEEPWR